MRRVFVLLTTLAVGAAASAFAWLPLVGGSSGKTIFEFDQMVGVSGAFLNPNGSGTSEAEALRGRSAAQKSGWKIQEDCGSK